MSISSASRSRLGVGWQSNLADVLARVTEHPALTDRQKQDLASALRTVGRALDKPLQEVPAHAGHLSKLLAGVAPAALDISDARWTNVVSLARTALRHAGVTVTPGRYREPFAPAWAAVFRLLERKHDRIALCRFARFCGSRGIGPEQVDDSVFDAFGADLAENALLRAPPRKVHRKAAVAWNRAVETVPEWPQHLVAVPSFSRAYALSWDTFPASLKADVNAYLTRLEKDDPLEPIDLPLLKPASIRTRRHQIQAYLSALVLRGRDPATLLTLKDAVALDVVREGLRFFLQRTPDGSKKQAYAVATVIRAIAKHWVGVDAEHLAELEALCNRLYTRQAGMTDANRERLRPFDDPENVSRLLNLPSELMAEAEGGGPPTEATALLAQTAVAVELLLMTALRRRNLAHLDLERHLVRSKGGGVTLRISGDEVKNGVEVDKQLPDRTVGFLNIYCEKYRPVLLKVPNPYLFPGPKDRPKSCERLAMQVTACVRDRCGLHVHMHLFRHITAKIFLDANPGAYGVVRLLHGHRSVETTTKYYTGMESAAALRHYDEHILERHAQAADTLPRLKKRAR